MKFTFEFLRNNTGESLFNKTLKTYEQLPIQSQGGSLMAYLILSKILMTMESVIEVMIKKISKVKVREIKGEDVEHVISMIHSTLDVLNGARDSTHHCVPNDSPKTVLQVLQTSSQPEIDKAFIEEQLMVQHKAD
jgi:hypothetical protein